MIEIAIDENSLGLIYTGIGIILGLAAIVGVIYNRGKKKGIDEACGKRIESKIDALAQEVGKKDENSNRTHTDLHTRIDECHSRINETKKEVTEVKSDVSYIKGKIDQVLK